MERARVWLTHSSEIVTSLPPELLTGPLSEGSYAAILGGLKADEILTDSAIHIRNTEITAIAKGVQAAINKAGASSSGHGDPEAGTASAAGGTSTSIVEISPADDDDDIYFGATPAGTVIVVSVVGSRPPGWGDQEAREAQYSERCNPCNWFNSAMAWWASGLTTKGLNTFFYGEPAAEA